MHLSKHTTQIQSKINHKIPYYIAYIPRSQLTQQQQHQKHVQIKFTVIWLWWPVCVAKPITYSYRRIHQPENGRNVCANNCHRQASIHHTFHSFTTFFPSVAYSASKNNNFFSVHFNFFLSFFLSRIEKSWNFGIRKTYY